MRAGRFRTQAGYPFANYSDVVPVLQLGFVVGNVIDLPTERIKSRHRVARGFSATEQKPKPILRGALRVSPALFNAALGGNSIITSGRATPRPLAREGSGGRCSRRRRRLFRLRVILSIGLRSIRTSASSDVDSGSSGCCDLRLWF